MRTESVSLTLDEGLLAEARDLVGSRKLSGYVNRALRLQLQHDAVGRTQIDDERQEGIMAKGNNAQKKETKKPKKSSVKGAADSKKDTKKK